ncbi:Olfactory receptor-like protein DTMT [Tupaia chinensis]|uniref:Olfactory receptor-like protein DTMT n=1 Tax=Tupaia chinensis TaxID=246437 RepID=L8Y410_TUPCH|nr:Olfactory receptor-like protein DTMT [Tupaia chinensis]
MMERNQTIISEFFLLGLPIQPEQQNQFYALFLAMYLTTVLGNLLIIILIQLDSHLHTPMYLFLSNLSFSDLCFSSVTMPKLLQIMQNQDSSIPYTGCLAQMYFFLFFADLESFLLVAMAYDRYVAICFPLHYGTIISDIYHGRPHSCHPISTHHHVLCTNRVLHPQADNSTVKETVMAMMYTVVTPMLNPFIYSLRNRDMKGALGRVICKKKIPFSL